MVLHFAGFSHLPLPSSVPSSRALLANWAYSQRLAQLLEEFQRRGLGWLFSFKSNSYLILYDALARLLNRIRLLWFLTVMVIGSELPCKRPVLLG